jgi:hypothetical protein
MPDGTIGKVRRPIAKDPLAGAPSTSGTAPKGVAQPAKVITDPSVPKPSPKTVVQPTKDQTVTPSKEPTPKVAIEKPAGAVPSAATPKKVEGAPKQTDTLPAHTSKLDAVSKSSRLFRRFHRVHKNVSRLVEVFDPYSDVDDYQDGDISIPDDSDDDSGNQSDDSDTSHNSQRNHSGTSSGTGGAATGTGRANNKVSSTAKLAQTGISAHKPAENKSTPTGLPKGTFVSEKEVLPIKGTGDNKTQHRSPKRLTGHAIHWEKMIAWSLVILFPLAYIGRTSL